MGPGRLRAQPLGVVAGSDEQGGGRVGTDAAERQEHGRGGEEEGSDELVEPGDLGIEEPDSMRQARDRRLRPCRDRVGGTGRAKGCCLGDQGGNREALQLASQLVRVRCR